VRLQKKKVYKLVAVLLIGLLAFGAAVVAQETSSTPEVGEPWACPEGHEGETLNIYNWSTYIGENTVADFEALCGVTVVYDVYDSNDTMISRLRQGNPGYDLVVPSDYAVPQMIEEGLLEPLNLDNIPNFKNLNPNFVSTIYDPDNAYALPYLLGTAGLGYNVNTVDEPVTSWMEFFEHDGPVAWTEDGRLMLSLALMLSGLDPNSSEPEDLEVAKQFLLDHSDNVVTIAQDDGQELLARGEVDMAIDYDGDFFQIIADCECEDYAYVIPEEGTPISSGFIAIPTGAQNHELAEVFLDYLLDPRVAADISNYVGYSTPNQVAIDAGLIDEEMLANKGLYPDEETKAKLYFILVDPDSEQLYNDTWDEIKAEMGQ